MRAPAWWRRRRTPAGVGTVTVELVADASRFVAAMDEAAEGIRRSQYRARFRHERAVGLAFVDVQLDELARSVGLDPVQAWRLPHERDALLEDLNHPSLERRRAAEAAWRAEHAAHRAAVVARREAAGDA